MEAELADLKNEVSLLRKELSRVSDEAEVRKVHFKYGYYLDKCLYNEVVDMFSDRPDAYVEFLGGRYRGKEGIRRLYQGRFQNSFVGGRNGPVRGFLLDHIMLQDIVDVNPQGTHAWCRMRALMQAGTHASVREAIAAARGGSRSPPAQWWEGGLYENEYVKEGGTWKLFRYRYFPFWHADYEAGWAATRENYVPWPTRAFPDDPWGPDDLLEPDRRMLWPDTRVVPFHYPHPVTGARVADDDLRAPVYGAPAAEADPPLSLALPEGQARAGGGRTWTSEGATRVLPELVENA
ncbi:SnoaL-like domain-containing protein [Biscogniauxia mediterranea]|nr:SnoaL-like domain-containing protein [Biscogniauxia mediterranea]